LGRSGRFPSAFIAFFCGSSILPILQVRSRYKFLSQQAADFVVVNCSDLRLSQAIGAKLFRTSKKPYESNTPQAPCR
jgi:hypothetical protein